MRHFALSALLCLLAARTGADPVTVSAVNPHYFSWNGRPLVLVTSDHHYGAVIDGDFDYVRFLDALSASGMNLTRIYPGAMFEPPDKYVTGNPLGPRPGRQVLPWARSTTPGAHRSLASVGTPSPKFDLDRWNPGYFERLRAFVAAAAARRIIVEVAFFNGMYADSWPLMPLYHENNVQGVGRYEADECGLFTTADARNRDVMGYQAAYVAKITTALNEFDNVIFDIADEPTLEGKPDGSIITLDEARVVPWVTAMAKAFLDAEATLPKKHVLGQTVQNLSPDLSGERWVDWLPTEYVTPAARALEKNYAARKPIVDVESDYYGHGLVKPYTVDDVRLEGWWFLLGGGAGAINLNGEFHHEQEAGGADTRDRILPERRALKQFMERLDLERVTRFEGVQVSGERLQASALADTGRTYAAYVFRATGDGQWGAHFRATPATVARAEQVHLTDVPAGRYRVAWIDPTSGRERVSSEVQTPGGRLALSSPPFTLDVALLVVRQP